MRRPDSAFRRFDVTQGDAGRATSDGPQAAVTSLVDDKFDVTVVADNYLFPAMETPDGAH
ncbi:hypothetical protein V474_11190 [Novosphingobium barchaimii LL02]|uniref:Uncharacterized protein n=1 Tax=Novosphingobium barchaimii LL02 TaxID=1114963 RepID=A0A0J7Y7X9_9SPHN|nr:hypothetical protein [Novosphingobium barchaimii]KMS59752.1 hypothetical protein V474_11190 [Novosphingobium barchaimii LL02]